MSLSGWRMTTAAEGAASDAATRGLCRQDASGLEVRVQAGERLVGVVLVVLSAIAWSLNGLYTRYLHTDVVTTLVGRAVAIAILLGAALFVLRRGEVRRLLVFNVRNGAVAIVSGALCMATFIGSLAHTIVANVTVIYAISPLIAAIIARFLIGDRLSPRTLVAFAFAVAGVTVMVGASFGTGRLLGDFLALLMSATFAVVIVEMRRKPDLDNLTVSLLTSILVVVVLGPFASPSQLTAGDALVLALFGFTSNVLGFFLFIGGVRRMPAAEAGLIATIEIVLAPLWVWLFFGEDPGRATFVGGAVVLAAVLFQIYGDLRRGRAREIVIAEGLTTEVETARKVL